MNVFDWRGPSFLLFFAVFGVVLVWLTRRLRASLEAPDTGDPARSHDPYLVACLRGGVEEVIRLAIVSLVDRELLAVRGDGLRSVEGALAHVRRPIERAIVTTCASHASLKQVVGSAAVREQAELLDHELAAQGYRALPRVQSGRLLLFLACAAISGYVALHKIQLAFQRGHSNVGFLIGLWLVLLFALASAAFPRRTRAGDERVAALKELFRKGYEARDALRPGGESTELIWLSAVFGVSALTTVNFPARNLLFPPAKQGSSSSCGSSSCGGSSCGSSSCGGGGCGGCGGGD